MELSWILSGQLLYDLVLAFILETYWLILNITYSLIYLQIAKLSMIPVSCLLEVVLDKIRYSRDTKLSIGVVLLGVGVCTITDASVNARGFIAAFIAVWSTSLQQYVSSPYIYAYAHNYQDFCMCVVSYVGVC